MAEERPIIFSAPMVRAILDGRKTQTRRVVKPQPSQLADQVVCDLNDVWRESVRHGNDLHMEPEGTREWRCPYGVPGDRMWVREAWRMVKQHDAISPKAAHLGGGCLTVSYPASDPLERDGKHCMGKKRPSIHMPRWASRLTLEVTGVRVERVQEVSQTDAKAEGVRPDCIGGPKDYRMEFRRLWDSINAKRGYPWDDNPWVWVVEFKRLKEGE